MTMTYVKAKSPGGQKLTVHYATTAALAASALDEKLRDVLVKAVDILAADPYPKQSEQLADDGDDRLRRIVRASQSLVVVYRADETHLLIEEVRTEAADQSEEPAAGMPESTSRREGVWQRVGMSAVQAPDSGPNGAPPGTA